MLNSRLSGRQHISFQTLQLLSKFTSKPVVSSAKSLASTAKVLDRRFINKMPSSNGLISDSFRKLNIKIAKISCREC